MNERKGDIILKIKDKLQRMELPIIYLIIITLIIFEAFALIFPPIKGLIADKGTLFIFIVLFLIFRYFVSKYETSNLNYFKDFAGAMDKLFENSRLVKQVDFIGLEGGYFCPNMLARDIQVNQMRALIRNPSPDIIYHHPIGDDQKKLKGRITDRFKGDWKSLDRNKVHKLMLKVYNFDPSFFAVIVDKKMGIFGFFKPIDKYHYFEVMDCFILTQNTEYEKEFLDDINEWFDQVFEHYAMPIENVSI